ncbi:MAG: pentapeptide repeat-containing protein, partial [Chloroflexota bacterium]
MSINLIHYPAIGYEKEIDRPLTRANVEQLLWQQEMANGLDLNKRNLRGADLSGLDLRDANLQGARLEGATLLRANLSRADLRGAKLEGADLSGAVLSSAVLWGADLRGANLRGADFWEAVMIGADLRGADLRGAKLEGTDLEEAKLEGADLRGARLEGANVGVASQDRSEPQHLTLATALAEKERQSAALKVALAEAERQQLNLRTELGQALNQSQLIAQALTQGDFGTPVTRYSEVRFPAQMSVGQQATLEVNLTLQELTASGITTPPSQAWLDHLASVTVNLSAPGFELLSPPTQMVELYPDRDSTPLNFLLAARYEGEESVSVSFWQRGKFVQCLKLKVVVTAAPSAPLIPISNIALFKPADTHTTPPDVQIYLDSSYSALTGKTLLDFSVDYFDGHYQILREPAGQLELDGEPRTIFEGLFERLHRLGAERKAEGQPLRGEEMLVELARIGQKIYQDYFPEKLKATYRTFRQSAKTMLIISNEPWIPWELTYFHDRDDSQELQDRYKGFLCEKFVVSRWLSATSMLGEIPLSTACCVIPSTFSREPLESFEDLRQDGSKVQILTPALPTKALLLERLGRGGFNLLHFTGSVGTTLPNSDHSSFRLENGEELLPTDFDTPKIEGFLKRTAPFFFLNGCQNESTCFEPVKLGGWATQLLKLGSSLLIGTLWEVNDQLAAEFARSFYTELLDGKTFGEASFIARHYIRALNPTDPAWLAYT